MHTTEGKAVVTVVFCSIFSKLDEAELNVLLLLLNMKINDEMKYSEVLQNGVLRCCKGR